MADHLTEEEQVEALKRWWNENWLSIVVPIVIFLAGYGGWNFWTGYQQNQAEAASAQYQELLDTVKASGPELTGENKTKAVALAESIVADYGSSMYVNLSTLLLAKVAVEDGELEKAAGLIRSVVDNSANVAISELAKTRLARVLSAQGKYDEALALVAATEAPAFASTMSELRGDIHFAQGALSLANAAYQEAIDNLAVEQRGRRGIIQIKLDNTSVASADAGEASEQEGA